uniref:Secreted RxLR effector protein 67 n=1 Tax=Plasmopara viticola TaxID=143451 RepID=RLR67_PLAVT|nr:RecName: Full=Secreted RxLR effector protein 67; Flags: Precursor [Plasmopara viticola]ANC73387.1 secreted RxLR effector peptide protein 67 [Plasmopara viticola]
MRLYILVLAAIAVTLVFASSGPAITYHEVGTRALRQASITDEKSDDSLNAQAPPLSKSEKRLSRSFRTTSRRLPYTNYYHPQYYHPQNYHPHYNYPQYHSSPHVYVHQESKKSWFVRMILEAGIFWAVFHCLSAAFC